MTTNNPGDSYDLIARQLQRELRSNHEAASRLQGRIQSSRDRSYASSNPDSRAFINSYLIPISELVKERYGLLLSLIHI